ncbi:MAG: energy-coupling factor ABC transporter ATP-binding protein [Bacteroidetes bacterium]|nr:energy-coupling factor ABC transporter ATP-binding protein [Bacteroidota bacterium]
MKSQIIKVRNLQYSYPDGTKALCGVDLDIFEGESVGLIGPNGAGKSTLLLHLNGILQGGSKVEITGLEINNKNLNFIRSKAGLVFQDPEDQLFMPTVFDDVAFGPINLDLKLEEVRGRVKKALQEIGMLDLAERVTHHLSFGEKKRISIATVLSMNPEILVLDEPSSNLDPKSRKDLIELLKKFNHTKIIAGHDLELILDTCGRVIVLDKGRIVTNGDSKEVLSNRSLMESHGLGVPLSLK